MWRLLICLLFVNWLAFTPVLGQQKTFELVGGHLLFGTLQGHTKGQYLAIRPVGRRDTLWLWIEGVQKRKGPSLEAARAADLVVWCYPKLYPDPRHVMPNTNKIGITTTRRNGKRWLSVVSMKTARRTGILDTP